MGGTAPRRIRCLARRLRAPGVFYKRDGEVGCRVAAYRICSLRAIEDRRQAMGMRSFALPGAARGGESIGERKNVAGDQEVLILGAHRMPIHAIGRDGDFRHQIRARKRDACSAKPRSAMRRITRSCSLIFLLSRNWRNSAASASVATVAASRTRNPSARARSMPFHALAQVPAPRC